MSYRLPPRDWDFTARVMFLCWLCAYGLFVWLLYAIGEPVLAGVSLLLWSAVGTLRRKGD